MDETVVLVRIPHDFVVGEVVRRVWGNGFLSNEMRVCEVDDEFIYCDAQTMKEGEWIQLPPGSDPWKFDRVWGVETDEEQRWGVEFGLALSRIEKVE